MVKKMLVLLTVGMLVFVACGGDDEGEGEEGDLAACSSEIPAAADVSDLPANFPIPGEVVLTGSSEAGPSQVIEGYFQADMDEAFPEYKEAFEGAGYEITKEEQEEDDAEIFFSGDDTTGQVNMFAECTGRTKLRITIRPA
jgi:hypothetical protein